MSKFSRTKGRRGEQELVLYLKNLGYDAERILRQYQEAGQPDVRATKDRQPWITFENKYRRESYKTIYRLYYEERGENGVLSFVLNKDARPVAMSTHFPDLLDTSTMYFMNVTNWSDADKKVFNRIVALEKLKQVADYLVIKDNGKPRLFIRYWL